jgi:hypothetical protein
MKLREPVISLALFLSRSPRRASDSLEKIATKSARDQAPDSTMDDSVADPAPSLERLGARADSLYLWTSLRRRRGDAPQRRSLSAFVGEVEAIECRAACPSGIAGGAAGARGRAGRFAAVRTTCIAGSTATTC